MARLDSPPWRIEAFSATINTPSRSGGPTSPALVRLTLWSMAYRLGKSLSISTSNQEFLLQTNAGMSGYRRPENCIKSIDLLHRL